MSGLFGIPVIESPVLPMKPTPGMWARRYVRHGMADVLAWLGEDVGPEPDAETHALLLGGSLHASAAIVGRLREGTLAPLAALSGPQGDEQASPGVPGSSDDGEAGR